MVGTEFIDAFKNKFPSYNESFWNPSDEKGILQFLRSVEKGGKDCHYSDTDRVDFFSWFNKGYRGQLKCFKRGRGVNLYSDTTGYKFFESLGKNTKNCDEVRALRQNAILNCGLDVGSIGKKERGKKNKDAFYAFLSCCVSPYSFGNSNLLAEAIDLARDISQEDILSYVKIICDNSPIHGKSKTKDVFYNYEIMHKLLLRLDSVSLIANYAPFVYYNRCSSRNHDEKEVFEHYISLSKRNGGSLNYDENLDAFINAFTFEVIQNVLDEYELSGKEYVTVLRCFTSPSTNFDCDSLFIRLNEEKITEDDIAELCQYPIIPDSFKMSIAKRMDDNETIKKIILTVKPGPLLYEIVYAFGSIMDMNFINHIVDVHRIKDLEMICKLQFAVPDYQKKVLAALSTAMEEEINGYGNVGEDGDGRKVMVKARRETIS